ncbi:MAG: T9SS type A sorting domain-containing protein [Phycisphaerae bacterium]|nr:T9SS type A sorting domain-containing protein [Saprospiraceae bacterium]
MRSLLLILTLLAPIVLSAQMPDAKRDLQWLVGYKDSVQKTVINLLDFNEGNPLVSISPFPVMDGSLPSRSIAAISDTAGHIILYTNGCNVLDKNAEQIFNGDHITPNNWVYDNYCPDYYPFTGSWLLLPDPAKDSLFYLFAIGHRQSTGAGIHAWGLYASRLSEQEVFEKNTLICADSIFGGHLTACRHANGRDWWLVLNKIQTNQYYKYLLDPTGIHLVDLQSVGMASTWNGSGSGQCTFSPNGTKFIHYENVADMYVFDFDRCSGALSNFRHVNIEHNEDTGNSFGGMAISPNSRFAYTFGYLYSYQVDLLATDLQSSVTQVAYWDSTYVFVWKTTFGKAALAPNGKIYSAIPGSNPYLHVIHNPDAKGDSCQFEQHGLLLPYSWNNNDLLNFPYYRLGRSEGSSCDTIYTKTEIGETFAFHIFPNPSPLQTTLSLPTHMQGHWMLFDVSGKKIRSGNWEGLSMKLDVLDLSPGLYIFQLQSKSGQLFFGKVAVQR